MYCLYDNCNTNHTQRHGLCVDIKNSTEVQGCVRDNDVVWDKVKNVTDFVGHDTENCTNTCKNMERDGIAITRQEIITYVLILHSNLPVLKTKKSFVDVDPWIPLWINC